MKKLLSLPTLKPIDKIVLLCIIENMVFNQCLMTSQEIATAIGETRKLTLNSIQKLEELDYIKCKVDGKFRERKTIITKRLNNLINE